MELKIIEPIQNYLKEFNTTDEFNLFYSKNKEQLDSETTHKLNKKYHIQGYRITKIKGELMLKKVNEDEEKDDSEIMKIKDDIAKIKITLNDVINFINSKT